MSTEKAKRAATYLKAAKIIERGGNKRSDGLYDGACDVICCFEYCDAPWEHRQAFRDIFVAGEPFYLLTDLLPIDEAQDWRVLALCFMAAMVEAGDA